MSDDGRDQVMRDHRQDVGALAAAKVRRLLVAVLLLTTAFIGAGRGADAATGQLTPVLDFGPNPGDLMMFEYVPADLPANAPLVVILHGCLADATVYDDETGWTELAERWKVALLLPDQTVANEPTKCFGFWKPEDNRRGMGEAASIRQMVAWVQTNHATDPARTFIMGHSGGALFTSVMLATYPEVFRAGAIVAGGPYGCGDEGAVVLGVDPQKGPTFSGECINGSTHKSAKEWGDLVRAAYPGYKGPRPRVSIFHGDADTTVTFENQAELVKQWTDVLGIDQKPDVVENVRGYPHMVYAATKHGPGLVETYRITGGAHGWSYDAGPAEDQCGGSLPSVDEDICISYYAGRWFGLGGGVRR